MAEPKHRRAPPEGRKNLQVYGVVEEDHDDLSLYASVHGITVADAFGKAVRLLVAKIDGVEGQMFAKAKANGRQTMFPRRGRRSTKSAVVQEGDKS